MFEKCSNRLIQFLLFNLNTNTAESSRIALVMDVTVCVYIHMYICMYLCECLYIYMYLHIYCCVHINRYVYTNKCI